MNFLTPKYEWYAIYTKTNGEKNIYKHLSNENIESYLPLSKKLRQWSDRKRWIEVPFFRNYLFVKVSHKEFFHVLKIPGVVNYISFGGQPQKIPAYQIAGIKKLIDQQEREVIVSREYIEKGQNAEILSGPLKGMRGEVVKIYGNYRIVIRIEALGCSIYANLIKDEINALPSDKVPKQEQIGQFIR